MSDYLTLSKMLLINTYRPGPGKNGKKRSMAGTIILLLFGMGYLGFLFYMVFASLFMQNMAKTAVTAALIFLCLFFIMTQLFVFPNTFFFSKDLPVLLPLPVKPWVLVAAKGSVVLASAVPWYLGIVLPLMLAGLIHQGLNGFQVLLFLLVSLLIVLGIFFIMGALTILAMSFLPFFANKDRFNLIIGLITLLGAVGLSVGSQIFTEHTMESTNAVANMLSQNGAFLQSVSGFLFQVPFAAQAVFGSWLDLLITLVLTVLFAAVFAALASKVYLRSASSSLASAASKGKKKLQFKKASAFSALVKTDWRIILKTPAYLTNMVISPFLMPLVFTAMAFFLPSFTEMRTLLLSLDLEHHAAEFGLSLPVRSMIAGMLCTFFFGDMNFVCPTAISRLGEAGLAQIKAMPIETRTFLNAKLVLGIAFTIVDSLAMTIPVLYITGLSPIWILPYLAGSIPAALLTNTADLALDIVHPKLVWDDENSSIKNNYNSVIEMFGFWALSGLAVMMLFVFHMDQTLLIILFGLLCIGVSFVLWKMLPGLFEKYLSNRI